MFVKHTFDVKNLFEILAKPALAPVSVTPQEQSRDMTAILTYPTNPPTVRQPVVDPLDTEALGACSQRTEQRAEVYRRRRLLVLAVLLSLCVGLWSFWHSADTATPQQNRSPDAVVVVVEPGDTLWSIATWLNSGADPRPLVDALSELVGSSNVYPGQRLEIPSNLLQ